MWKNKEKTVNKMLKETTNSGFVLSQSNQSVSSPHVNKKRKTGEGLVWAFYDLYTCSQP